MCNLLEKTMGIRRILRGMPIVRVTSCVEATQS